MIKRIRMILIVILTLALFISINPMEVFAATYVNNSSADITAYDTLTVKHGIYTQVYGACTITLNYDTGLFSITGSGAIPYLSSVLLKVDKLYFKYIEIGEGITQIANSCFAGYSNVINVKLPSSLTEIADYAFSTCGKLENITLPKNLKYIGDFAFAACEKLTSINLPNGLISIGRDAFENCISLTSINIPDSVTLIGDGIFSGCKNLQSVVIGKGVTNISSVAFGGCISLTYVSLPDTLKTMEHGAFVDCTSLRSIIIPAGVTKLDYGYFYRCNKLDTFYAAEGGSFIAIDGVLYSADRTELILCPPGKSDVVVPEGVQKLARNSFSDNEKLKSVKLPKTLELIDWNFNYCFALTSIDFGGTQSIMFSFTNCTSLKNLIIPGSVKLVNGFMNCYSLETIVFMEGVQSIQLSFRACEALKSISFPESVNNINSSFIECFSLTSVTIPKGVEKIISSFWKCNNLSELYIEDGVKYINQSFSDCVKLTDITLPNSIIDIIGSFDNCTSLKSVYFYGNAPVIVARKTESPSCYFSSDAVLYYIDGKDGWSSPAWNGYNSAVWTVPVPSLNNFTINSGNYTPHMFSDVDENAWYGENKFGVVGTAVRLGIMQGMGNNIFSPDTYITYGEAIKMAAVVHNIYYGNMEKFNIGNPWYQVFADYSSANNIIKNDDFTNYDAYATRAELAYIFANSIPETELSAKNTLTSIPDVNINDKYGNEIFLLYRAGILIGNDSQGTFSPNSYITRAEAAALISRIALIDKRG